jgi:hypothetical protein
VNADTSVVPPLRVSTIGMPTVVCAPVPPARLTTMPVSPAAWPPSITRRSVGDASSCSVVWITSLPLCAA